MQTAEHPNSPAKVLILSQYSLPANKQNMNVYQRVFYGSQYSAVTLLLRRSAEVSEELSARVKVRWAPVDNRWLFLIYSVFMAFVLRFTGHRYLLTEPSGFAAAGFLAKYLAGYTWALDVWDRPRWRTGQHEDEQSAGFSDRLVFWLMRHADIYLMSVLPRAAKDIRPDPSRCVQLYNAISLSLVADHPPERSREGDQTLRLVYGRSQFWDTMGLDVVIKAAERLKEMSCPVLIHLIGEMPASELQRIDKSKAASCFQVHGFIQATRVEFFKTIHVGLVPYPAYEDLSYIFPIKVLEHLSQGNPVVASRLPGLCAMVENEKNGLVVEAGNHEELAAAISRLQADVELYNRLARQALDSIRRFDVEAKNKEIFETLLNWTVAKG